MQTFLTALQDVFTYGGPWVLLATLFLLITRRHARTFPWFSGYLALVTFNQVLGWFCIYKYGVISAEYFYLYWVGSALAVIVSFAVLYEVLIEVLTSGTVRISKGVFFLTVSVIWSAALILALRFDAPRMRSSTQMIVFAESAVRFSQIGVLAVLLGLTRLFGFYWSSLAFGISAGFGYHAVITLTNMQILRHSQPGNYGFVSLMGAGSYIVASLIWLLYAARKPKLPIQVLSSHNLSGYSEPINKLIQ